MFLNALFNEVSKHKESHYEYWITDLHDQVRAVATKSVVIDSRLWYGYNDICLDTYKQDKCYVPKHAEHSEPEFSSLQKFTNNLDVKTEREEKDESTAAFYKRLQENSCHLRCYTVVPENNYTKKLNG